MLGELELVSEEDERIKLQLNRKEKYDKIINKNKFYLEKSLSNIEEEIFSKTQKSLRIEREKNGSRERIRSTTGGIDTNNVLSPNHSQSNFQSTNNPQKK